MNIKELYNLFKKYPLISTDSRNIAENSIFFALKGANFNGNKYAKDSLEKGAKFAIVDEENFVINEKTILVKNVLTTLQELAAYHRDQLTIPIIGITGSNGKTTTKELIREVLKVKYNTFATHGNLNNHIGVPLSLLSINDSHEIAIIEMGANHQGEIAFLSNIAKPTHGLITNVGKAHLEGFGGFEGVVKGKSELYYFLLKNNCEVFVNASDEHLTRMATRFPKTITYNGGNNDLLSTKLIGSNPFIKFEVKNKTYTSHLLGEYNYINIASALTIGKYFNVETHAACEKIEQYNPDNNRSQIEKIESNTVILDAYNANPTSMIASINSFSKINSKNKILVLGDMFELGESELAEHQNIVSLCHKLEFNNIYLCGEAFYKTEASPSFKKYKSIEELKTVFKIEDFNDSIILLKGSRGMKLETLIK